MSDEQRQRAHKLHDAVSRFGWTLYDLGIANVIISNQDYLWDSAMVGDYVHRMTRGSR